MKMLEFANVEDITPDWIGEQVEVAGAAGVLSDFDKGHALATGQPAVRLFVGGVYLLVGEGRSISR